MPRGGARVNSGPPPDPNALRRARPSDQAQWTTLPLVPEKPAPAWPLLADVRMQVAVDQASTQVEETELLLDDPALTPARRATLDQRLARQRQRLAELVAVAEQKVDLEAVLWAEAWGSPPATMWHRYGYVREVAQYVRWKAQAELGDLKASTEARQLADRLGLNPAAMQRLRWRVAADELAPKREQRRRPAVKRVSARDRLAKLASGDA